MNKLILLTATILGLLSVILGAFASHGLKELITPEQIQIFETGIKYQMYHAFLLLFMAIAPVLSMKAKRVIFYLTVIGILFFSGSIYGLATNNLTTFNFKTIALITPVGGLLLIGAWAVMLINFLKMKME